MKEKMKWNKAISPLEHIIAITKWLYSLPLDITICQWYVQKIIMTHWNIARRITRKQVISLVLTQNKHHLPPFIHLQLQNDQVMALYIILFLLLFFLKQVTLDILFVQRSCGIFSLGNSVCNNDEYSIANWYLKF